MTNKEKEYYDDLKERIKKSRYVFYADFSELEFLINTIENQQKEIEKLSFENHMIKKWNEQLDKNCISKDKIREKIEHYNNELEHIKNGEEFENEKPMYYWGKVALEVLLEDN